MQRGQFRNESNMKSNQAIPWSVKISSIYSIWKSSRWLSAKEFACSARAAGDAVTVPEWGRSPRGGPGNPLQYSCLGNPRDGGAWWATIHRVAKSQTRMKRLSMHTHIVSDRQPGTSPVGTSSMKPPLCLEKNSDWWCLCPVSLKVNC